MSKSALNLSREELEHIKAYRYATNGLTPLEIAVFEPFWNFVANNMYPDWLAPNAITLIGVVIPLVTTVLIDLLHPDLTGVFPKWLVALSLLSNFWYQTLDATDGKQARRTNNCSPLGQILDHNLDQLSQTCFMIAIMGLVQAGPSLPLVLFITPGVFSPHFLVEYRTHFTNFHQLVVAGIGATEQVCIIMSIVAISLFQPDSTNCYHHVLFTLGGRDYTGVDGIIFIAFSSGFYYNLENLYHGYKQASDKSYALKCLVPYLQFFVMIIASSYSRFWETRMLRFLVIVGIFLLYANCYLNLCTMCKRKYDWVYLEPYIYLVAVYLDAQMLVSEQQAVILYLAFFAWILTKYMLLMYALVDQITSYLGIRFLHNKPVQKKQN